MESPSTPAKTSISASNMTDPSIPTGSHGAGSKAISAPLSPTEAGSGAPTRDASKEFPPSSMPSITAADLPRWQHILTKHDSERLDWPITRLCLPGTHDSGTYGPGTFPTNVARFNWHCQSHNFYEQARLGIRYFDLRLARGRLCGSKSKFWPFHGAASHVGDVFADGPMGIQWKASQVNTIGWEKTIAGQLLKFVSENPSEVFVIHLTVQDNSRFKDTIWETLLNTLNESGKCVPSPDGASTKPGHIPTIAEARRAGQNFVLIADNQQSSGMDSNPSPKIKAPEDPFVATFVKDYTWKMPGARVLKGQYVSKLWKMNSPEVVRKSIEDWMAKHETQVQHLDHFWAAQCQLTPSINNVCDLIESLWNKKLTSAPAKLSPIMNPYVKDVLMQDPTWKQRVSMVQVDFPDAELVLSIVRVNFDDARK